MERWDKLFPTPQRQVAVSSTSGPQTEDELRDFVFRTWGAEIPDEVVCECHTTPWRAFADAYFAKHPVSIWKASRGYGGKSFLLALLGLTEAVALGSDVNILGGSFEQSSNVLTYASKWWGLGSAPTHLLRSEPGAKETRLVFGNRIRALMASQRSVRGPHPQRLRLDEIDEMDLRILEAAQGQPMTTGGILKQTVMSSTHQYADGTMTKILNRAAENGWPVYEWCYRENMEPHGWLSNVEVETKKNEVTQGMWDAEYELQEPSPENRAIDTDAVKAMFLRELGVFTGEIGEYIEIEPPERFGLYSTGADWGKKTHFTVIVTVRGDCNPARLVAYERRRREPWPMMVGRFDQRLDRYGGLAAHDATGIGDVVADLIKHSVKDVIMAGRNRADLLSEYIAAVERGEYVAPFITAIEREHRLASTDDVYSSAQQFHLPDGIAAMALAHRALPVGAFKREAVNAALTGASGLKDVPHPAEGVFVDVPLLEG